MGKIAQYIFAAIGIFVVDVLTGVGPSIAITKQYFFAFGFFFCVASGHIWGDKK